MTEDTKETPVNVDIGGFYGWGFIDEARQHPAQRFVVIDPKAGPPLKEKIPSNLTYIRGQIEAPKEGEDSAGGIPLKDASADRVWIEQVFDVIGTERWRPLFTEANRILKKGGRLEIIDLTRNENEIKWSLPTYGFGEIKTRPLKEKEGSQMTGIFAEHPEIYSPPVYIMAIKSEDKKPELGK